MRIEGRLLGTGLTLTSPLSGRSCAWYAAYVDEYAGGIPSENWRPLVHEERCVVFVVDDGTAVARVQCVAPRVAAPIDHDTRSCRHDDAEPVELALLSRHGLRATGWFGLNRHLRYQEAALEAGTTVVIIRRVRAASDHAAPYEILPPNGGPMLIFTSADAAE